MDRASSRWLLLLTRVADITANILLIGFICWPLHAAFFDLLLAAEGAVHEQPEKHHPQGRSHPPVGSPTSPSKEKSSPRYFPGTQLTNLRQEQMRKSGQNLVSCSVQVTAGIDFKRDQRFSEVSILKGQPCFHTDSREERREKREEKREGLKSSLVPDMQTRQIKAEPALLKSIISQNLPHLWWVKSTLCLIWLDTCVLI